MAQVTDVTLTPAAGDVVARITTADGTTATSQSIGKLAELATQLRDSVSGFRLAGSTAGTERRT
jgi:hypothetical protein